MSLEDGVKKIKDSEKGRPVEGEVTFFDNIRVSTRPDGAIDTATFDSYRTGRVNGGIACDVTWGPCRCGAWH